MKLESIQIFFSKSLIFRASAFWLGLCILAFVNGALREIVFKPFFKMSELSANQLSCLSGVLLWTAFTVWLWKPLNIKSLREASLVGFGWFLATILFETFFIDRNLDWVQIVDTYDISSGQLWGLVLIWIGLMPVVILVLKAIGPVKVKFEIEKQKT